MDNDAASSGDFEAALDPVYKNIFYDGVEQCANRVIFPGKI